MIRFKHGDRVRMKYFDGYATGEITIVDDEQFTYKVIWDADYDLDYWYYLQSDLELINEPRPTEEIN